MNFNPASSRQIKVTPQMATELLTHNTFIGQRRLNAKHMNNLARIMKNGQFRPGHIALADIPGGSTVVMNGQHQLHAVITSGVTVPAILEKYKCRTMAEASELFRSFDNNKVRGFHEISVVEARCLGIDWPERIIDLVTGGAAWIEGKQKCHKNDKVVLLQNYLPEGDFINRLIKKQNSETRHLCRQSVCAVIMMTWRKNQRDSENFWTMVRNGEGQKKSMPSYKLREWLMMISVNRGQGAAAIGRQKVDERMIIVKCISAWNAFRQRKTTSLKYYSSKDIPKVI